MWVDRLLVVCGLWRANYEISDGCAGQSVRAVCTAMPTRGQTSLVIPVPAADALLASVGTRYPGTVRDGLPAHVSLLYPFVVAAELDERVTTALHELFVEQVPNRPLCGSSRR